MAWKAPGYESLVVPRILTGLAHGVFFSIGSTIATSLVPKEKAASAIAIMFTGLIVEHVGLVHTGWIGALVVLGAYGLTALSGRLDRLNPRAVVAGETRRARVAAR